MLVVVVAVVRCCLLFVVRCCLAFAVCRLFVWFVDVGCWCRSSLIDGCCSLLCIGCLLLLCISGCSYGIVVCFVVGYCVLLVDGCCRVRLFVVLLCVGDYVLVVVCLL